jgi:hypothetical protein
MAIKMKFKDGVPVKLISYGSFPLRNSKIIKTFDGPKCHIKFLLWVFQNVIEYKIDTRRDQTLLSIFTVGG